MASLSEDNGTIAENSSDSLLAVIAGQNVIVAAVVLHMTVCRCHADLCEPPTNVHLLLIPKLWLEN